MPAVRARCPEERWIVRSRRQAAAPRVRCTRIIPCPSRSARSRDAANRRRPAPLLSKQSRKSGPSQRQPQGDRLAAKSGKVQSGGANAGSEGGKDDEDTAYPNRDGSSDGRRTPNLESRGDAMGGNRGFACPAQGLFDCSAGGMHVRHASLPRGEQMGLHLAPHWNGKELHLQDLLATPGSAPLC